MPLAEMGPLQILSATSQLVQEKMEAPCQKAPPTAGP